MKITFFLKNPNAKRQTAIFARVNYKYKELNSEGKTVYKPAKLSLGLSIEPSVWNQKTEKARETSSFPEHPEFNERLGQLKSEISKCYFGLAKENKLVSPEMLLKAWNKFNDPETRHNDFLYFAKKFIRDVEEIRQPGSIKNYKNSLKHIKEFSEKKGKPLAFSNIDHDFYLSLIDYLSAEKGFSKNTIWRISRTLKSFLNEAFERGLPVNPAYKSKKFSVSPEDTESIYLTTSEIDKLQRLDLSDNKRLEKVRDLFLIGCYTGLRFGDLSRLDREDMTKETLKIKTQKTGEVVQIPLHPIVIHIVNKYNGKLPKAISNQKFNKFIKEVCKMAEVNEKISVDSTKGQMRLNKTVEKWSMVSAHTARRSFCTNAFLARVPVIQLMKISGHKTEKAFLAYIRVGKEENATVLKSHPFFSDTILKVAT